MIGKIYSLFGYGRNLHFEHCVASVREQQRLAMRIGRDLLTDVYVFDATSFFAAATHGVDGTVRYLERDGKIAVLSVASQRVCKSSAEYLQLSNENVAIEIDQIGIKIPLKESLNHDGGFDLVVRAIERMRVADDTTCEESQ